MLKMNSASSAFSEHLNLERKESLPHGILRSHSPQDLGFGAFAKTLRGQEVGRGPWGRPVQKPGDPSPTFSVTLPGRPSPTTGFKGEPPSPGICDASSLSFSEVLSISSYTHLCSACSPTCKFAKGGIPSFHPSFFPSFLLPLSLPLPSFHSPFLPPPSLPLPLSPPSLPSPSLLPSSLPSSHIGSVSLENLDKYNPSLNN